MNDLKRKVIISVITIITFIAIRYLKYFYGYIVFGKEQWNIMDFDLKVSIINYTGISIVLLATFLLFRKLPFEYLGLKKDIGKGLLYGFICTLPMFIGYGYMSGFHTEYTIKMFHRDFILAGFYEEFLFRGFAFGLLFYYGGLGFVSAVFIPSVLFGMGHLYQAENFSDGLGVFLFTALGGAGFAWFYYAWGSLWMVLFLHGFMDMAWEMFDIQTNVTGDLNANIFRFATLGLAIFFSVQKAKERGVYSLRGKLWINRD